MSLFDWFSSLYRLPSRSVSFVLDLLHSRFFYISPFVCAIFGLLSVVLLNISRKITSQNTFLFYNP